ncbi:hypothetical protein GOBAR_DD12374 [Gossypium barbadense]|nr:hypothetical protein GOBAR_DD12374 [Gossypium barbadense]
MYFPPSKNAKLRNEITTFQQLDDESLYEAWERFKELLRKCPHYGIPHCIHGQKLNRKMHTLKKFTKAGPSGTSATLGAVDDDGSKGPSMTAILEFMCIIEPMTISFVRSIAV